jgi:hypothetical protein
MRWGLLCHIQPIPYHREPIWLCCRVPARTRIYRIIRSCCSGKERITIELVPSCIVAEISSAIIVTPIITSIGLRRCSRCFGLFSKTGYSRSDSSVSAAGLKRFFVALVSTAGLFRSAISMPTTGMTDAIACVHNPRSAVLLLLLLLS